MRLTYLFLRKRGYKVADMQTDGHFPLMQALVKEGYVDSARLVLENGRVGEYHVCDGVTIYEYAGGIDAIELEPDEIVWVRGAWKSWIPWITRHQDSHWIMYYGANAGHAPWPYWDVVLDDENGRSVWNEQTGRLYLDYRKPVHHIFEAHRVDRKYDLCIGASHIYDRKGQYRVFNVMKEYYRRYGEKLNCVMPGCFYSHEQHTEAMRRELPNWPNVVMPGFVPREDLVNIYADSRIFIHQTDTGQGDRGPMEAGRCGCFVVVGSRRHHAPYVYSNPLYSAALESIADDDAVIDLIRRTRSVDHLGAADYFLRESGMDTAVMPRLRPLFEIFRQPKDRGLLREYGYGNKRTV